MNHFRFTAPIIFLCILAAADVAGGASAQSDATISIVAIDADITGNTATSLGPLNACVRAEPGSSVTLDLVVDAVPSSRPFIGYQVNIEYDPSLLEVTAADNEFLLGASGSFEPFEGLSEPLPDKDGNYLIVVADIASQPELNNMESGAGVLTRLTFAAKGTGLSTVAPGFDPPDTYPALIDDQNMTIGVDSVGIASVAVGQDCPGPPEATPPTTDLPPIDQIQGLETPMPTPSASPDMQTPAATASGEVGTSTGAASRTPRATSDGDVGTNMTDAGAGNGGSSAGTMVAVVGLAVVGIALGGAGAYVLVRRRLGGGPSASP